MQKSETRSLAARKEAQMEESTSQGAAMSGPRWDLSHQAALGQLDACA